MRTFHLTNEEIKMMKALLHKLEESWEKRKEHVFYMSYTIEDQKELLKYLRSQKTIMQKLQKKLHEIHG